MWIKKRNLVNLKTSLENSEDCIKAHREANNTKYALIVELEKMIDLLKEKINLLEMKGE